MVSAAPAVVATILVHCNQPGLDEVLRCLDRQTRRPDAVVIVDNGLPPAEVAADVLGQVPVRVLRNGSNLGVGGGHNRAMRAALDAGAANIWLLEHDTFPDPGCLAALLAHAATDAVVVSRLVRNDYERRYPPGSALPGIRVPRHAAVPGADRFTLNSVLVGRDVVARAGLLREDLFVGGEDWDYSRRVVHAGCRIVQAPAAVAIHANKGAGRFGEYESPGRLYYATRGRWLTSGGTSARDLARCLAELVRPGRGRHYAAARWHAWQDGRRGRGGPAAYPFMREEGARRRSARVSRGSC